MKPSFDFTNVSAEAKKDIIELDRRTSAFKTGKEDEDRFKHFRLTRGVYGQRQTGVQMFRIKIPFGKLSSDQLVRIADISERYTNGNLHITTRQNIQLHFVKLEDAAAIWTELAQKGITAREACGNTVRNLTASARAGIDPDEPFDVSPYVYATFKYFLRNPVCQNMGRKIKPAFSSSEKDSAFAYFHDFGFIPRVRYENGKEIRGFKVLIGGGLGAISRVAKTAYEFLEEDRIIPFIEACIRVFDRYGEREKRQKARLKFLLKKIGFENFMDLVELERLAFKNQRVVIDREALPSPKPVPFKKLPLAVPLDADKYRCWLKTNVFAQKQKRFFGIQLRVPLGNIDAVTARGLAELVSNYAADDIRLSINQGILLRFVRKESLPQLFNELDKLGLAEPGFNTTMDITACPGTDTCALGVTNSTGLARILEEVLLKEYPGLVEETNLKIKISGCMNSCGQHMAANIGFHGSSIKRAERVVPAMQVVIGGGVDPDGNGFIAEKVIKLPSKRIPNVLRAILDDYENNAFEEEYFNDYFQRQSKRYFYDLLKPLSDISSLEDSDFFDWGQERVYRQSIGVGECAGVSLDVVGIIIADAGREIDYAGESFDDESWADSIYHSYTALVIGAKALLLCKDVRCNTHKGILEDFQLHYVDDGTFQFAAVFPEFVLQINKNVPSRAFAEKYLLQATDFVDKVIATRRLQLDGLGGEDKLVIENYYKA